MDSWAEDAKDRPEFSDILEKLSEVDFNELETETLPESIKSHSFEKPRIDYQLTVSVPNLNDVNKYTQV